MIKIHLRDGTVVDVKKGKAATYVKQTQTNYESQTTEEILSINLEIRDGARIDSNILASFVAADVLYFTDDGKENETDET